MEPPAALARQHENTLRCREVSAADGTAQKQCA